ncbi:MAG TPA: cupin domain-containing protein [Burkholderiales bacterium]|jgi:mannose-6-phosphate isomerase-like protein (cupin superfamily)
MVAPKNLSSTFIVMQPDQSAVPVEVSPTVFEELDRRFDGFKGRVLVSSYSFDCDWATWEMHPAGDEVVCLLSGDVQMVLDRGGVEEVTRLTEPGTYVVVPKGTWHTARTRVPTAMLFVTPGQDTQNKPV